MLNAYMMLLGKQRENLFLELTGNMYNTVNVFFLLVPGEAWLKVYLALEERGRSTDVATQVTLMTSALRR